MLENRLELHLFSRIFNAGVWTLTSIAVLIPLTTLMFIATATDSDNYWDEYHKKYGSLEVKSNRFRLDHAIHDEILYPDVQSLWIPLPYIQDSLLFIEYNDRPDYVSEEFSILLGLKAIKTERFVKEGEKVYFSCLDQQQIAFSDHPTSFWAEMKLNEDGGLDVVLNTEYLDKANEEVFKSSSSFTIDEKRKKTYTEIEEGTLKDIAGEFVLAKCYAPDQLFSLYGGEKYKIMQGRHRLSIPNGTGNSQLFVKSGDLLTQENGKWVVAEHRNTRGKPLAAIKSIQGKNCELILWCEKGISSVQMSLPVDFGGLALPSAHDTFLKTFKRTESSVLCQLGGKSTIIRKGDWLMKKGDRWRNLRNVSDLKEFLGYALKGELFIFDGIEVRDDVNYFTGHYFNDERTQVLKIDLKLGQKIRKENSVPKKKKLNPRLIPSVSEGAA